VSQIQAQIEDGVNPKDMAVIVKKNKSLEVIGKALLEKNIPVSMSKSESIWENEVIALIVKIVRYIDSLAGTYGKER
jgi:ATP-dependent exoDNAse (exonuclease V) beta subunit